MLDQELLSQEIFGFVGLSYEAKREAARLGLRYLAELIHLVVRTPLDLLGQESQLFVEARRLFPEATTNFTWTAPYHTPAFMNLMDQPIGALGLDWYHRAIWHLVGAHYVGNLLWQQTPETMEGWSYQAWPVELPNEPLRLAMLPPVDWEAPPRFPPEWVEALANFRAAMFSRLRRRRGKKTGEVVIDALWTPMSLHPWSYVNFYQEGFIWSEMAGCEIKYLWQLVMMKDIHELLAKVSLPDMERGVFSKECDRAGKIKFIAQRLDELGLSFGMSRQGYLQFLAEHNIPLPKRKTAK